MPDLSAPFVIAASVRLPGLGVLVSPAPPVPDWLATYELHTALAVTLPTGVLPSQALVGTIEEVARDGQPTQRALLLDFDPNHLPAAGTRLQVNEALSDLF